MFVKFYRICYQQLVRDAVSLSNQIQCRWLLPLSPGPARKLVELDAFVAAVWVTMRKQFRGRTIHANLTNRAEYTHNTAERTEALQQWSEASKSQLSPKCFAYLPSYCRISSQEASWCPPHSVKQIEKFRGLCQSRRCSLHSIWSSVKSYKSCSFT